MNEKFRIAVLDPGGRSRLLDAFRLRIWDWRACRRGFRLEKPGPDALSSCEPLQKSVDPDLLTPGFYRKYLLDDLLPFWTRTERGGVFRVALRRDGTSRDGPAPSATSQARMVYAFSRAYTVQQEPEFRSIATRAVDHLISAYWDMEFGGWYRRVGACAGEEDNSKFSFDQAYAITGLSEYLRVTGDERAKHFLIETLNLVQEHIWDASHCGYFEWLNRDWSIRSPKKTLCIHVDLLAGLLAANSVLPEQRLLQEIKALADLMRNRMCDPKTPQLLEVYRRDFAYSPANCDDTLTMGHAFKVAKHFLMVSDVTGDPSYGEMARRIADHAVDIGWDHEQGGIFHDVFRNGVIKNGDKVWWTVCEAMITLLMMAECTGKYAYMERYHELASFAFRYFADPDYGEWITSTFRDGAPRCTDKGGTYEKAAFHTVEMVSYALAAFERKAGNSPNF